MRPEARCSHPGCDRPATEVAVVGSEWEDSAKGSALMVCSDHAEMYVRRNETDTPAPGTGDAMLRARRRGPSG